MAIPPEKGKTAKEFIASERYDLEKEKLRLKLNIERWASVPDDHVWPRHTSFGKLSRRQYGKLAYKHTDHHFRQFGVI